MDAENKKITADFGNAEKENVIGEKDLVERKKQEYDPEKRKERYLRPIKFEGLFKRVVVGIARDEQEFGSGEKFAGMYRKPRGIELSGEKNLTKKEYSDTMDAENSRLMGSISPMLKRTLLAKMRGQHDPMLVWKPDELAEAVLNYFEYFEERGLKPSKSSLRIWLGVSKVLYSSWERNSARYGEISDIINFANDMFETQYINRGETHPTMNQFLLKAEHGMKETNVVEVANVNVDVNEIEEALSKLGIHEAEFTDITPFEEDEE